MGRQKTIDNKVIQKCSIQTEKLFQAFLDVDSISKETEEVGYYSRDNEVPLRSGSFGSAGSFGSSGSLVSRGGVDATKYVKLKSKQKFGSSTGSIPTKSSLESDSAIASNNSLQRDCLMRPSSASFSRPQSAEVIKIGHPYRREESEDDGDLIAQDASRSIPQGPSGPSEELIQEAAQTIADAGDKIEKKYGDKMNRDVEHLGQFIKEKGKSLTYEVFAATINDLVDNDRNWTNFMLVMHIGKRVVSSSTSAGTNARNFFAQYIGAAFGEEVARVGDAQQYVREHANDL